MGTPTVTPNIGLQIPALYQGNWQVPTNYDWQLLDAIFGGEITVPALNVTSLTVADFTITNIGTLIASACVQEEPSGAFPGTVYTLTKAPLVIIGLYYNGLLIRSTGPTPDYSYLGNAITLTFSTSAGDTLYAVYF